MKIKKVSTDEVIVFLSNEDIAELDLRFNDNIPQPADLHRFITGILDVVREETGFDPSSNGGQVMVEARNSRYGLSLIIKKPTAYNRDNVKNKVTADEFKQVKRVLVKSAGKREYSKNIPMDSDSFEKMERRRDKLMRNKSDCTVFIFAGFEEMENALCLLPEKDLRESSLYRQNGRYAMITRLCVDDASFNILIEYAEIYSDEDVLMYDIKEGWQQVAEAESLFEMAEAVKSMN